MKILKNIFGTKTKQNSKYEPNTLAEMNESPDLRLATAKEKEVDITAPKSVKTTKASKSESPSSNKKTKSRVQTPSSESKKTKLTNDKINESESEKVVKISSKSSNSQTKDKPKATKTTLSETKSSTKEATMKNESAKPAETKKTSTSPAKKAAAKEKQDAPNAVKKQATRSSSDVKTNTIKDNKSEPSTKNSTASTNKKVTEATTKSVVNKVTKKDSAPKKADDNTKKSTKQIKSTDEDIITESKSSKSGKFEIKKSKDGRFVFNLYASNNLIVATSQVYTSSTSAMNGIKSVIANASSSPIEDQTLKKVTQVPFPKWEIYLDKGDEYRFRLCASNGSCICHSQGYTTKASCKKGIESIIKFASDAEITKVYLDKNKNKDK